jgi:hypothetical protein
MPMAIHSGIEYKPLENIALRGGVESLSGAVSTLNITAGVGVDYKGIDFDYAYVKDGALDANSTHYFSISFAPEEINQKKEADKIVSAPIIIEKEPVVQKDDQALKSLLKISKSIESSKVSKVNKKSAESIKVASKRTKASANRIRVSQLIR